MLLPPEHYLSFAFRFSILKFIKQRSENTEILQPVVTHFMGSSFRNYSMEEAYIYLLHCIPKKVLVCIVYLIKEIKKIEALGL
jgi:hypothetical protein